VENLDHVDVYHAWGNLGVGDDYTHPTDWLDARERVRARHVNWERDTIGWWGDFYLCGSAAASQFEFELDAYFDPRMSARARGKCEADQRLAASHRIGMNRKRGRGDKGSGNGWKQHRDYQAHGRRRIGRVDVIDALNGMIPVRE
jgi:hypothetical protein